MSFAKVNLHLHAYRHIVRVDAKNNNVLLDKLGEMQNTRVDLFLKQVPVGMNTRSMSVL